MSRQRVFVGTVVICFALIISFACTGSLRADVRLPQVFGDHMVLQQQVEAPVWGWADVGEDVTVTLGEVTQTIKTGEDGKWSVRLKTPAAGGPHALVVAGKNTITINDVLIGEVWVCSGQSNMQWAVTQADNPQEEIAAANFPTIRLFTVARNITQQPQEDCQGVWQVCSPETVPGFSAVAYFFGRKLNQDLNVPIGLVNSSWGGTVAEAWTSRETLAGKEEYAPILERANEFNAQNPNQASVLYNGMIHPLIPFGIRGAIWYQGESNVARAAQYEKLFPDMITDWRTHWKQGDFPFFYVQLAPFRYRNLDPRMCAELWEAQLKTLSAVPNTGMAVTVDVGNIEDIHPKNKQEVGRRLALWALAQTYGKTDIVYSGPLYESMAVEGDKIRLTFRHVDGGLASRDGQPLTHFMIAGAEGEFVDATAVIDGMSVVVSSPQVPSPTAVRFAWRDDAQPNLMNAAGLPASPFRTDTLERLTANNR